MNVELTAQTFPSLGTVIQSKIVYFAAQSIAVNAQCNSGFGVISVIFIENLLDKLLFKFRYSISVKDPLLDHLANEGFKLVFQGITPINLISWRGRLRLP